MLAYKAEYLNQDDIIRKYISFVRKIEKGKFRWGSRADLCSFEQQLVYSVSVKNMKANDSKTRSKVTSDDRKKYCLDFNRGTCKQNSSHEGKLNGVSVFKLHICKLCLARDDLEENHPAKEYPRYK